MEKKSKNNAILNAIWIIFILGIIWRLIIIIFQTHVYDSLNIIALFKSVFDTNNLTDGFFALKNKDIGDLQLYGKIFYQIGALWLLLLEKIKILEVKYIFDTKPYDSLYSYLEGFKQWSIPLYQIVSIKFFQIFIDFLILFFLIKIFNLIKPQENLVSVFLFWAFYPLLPYTSYVLLQSDYLLLLTILSSLYFILLYLIHKKFIYAFFSIIFISLGATIKQVPILLLPFILIIFSNSLIIFIKMLLTSFFSYFIFSQFWSQDFLLIKKFLVNSPESLRLFSFNLNSVPVFFILYFLLIIYVINRKEIFKKEKNFILILYILLLSIVYVTYDIQGLFVQFNLWISPLILLISLADRKFSLFLTLPMIGFFKRALEDNDVILGSFGAAFGSPLHHTLKYDYFIKNLIHPEVIMSFFRSLFFIGYLLLAYLLIKKIEDFNNNKKNIKINNFIFNPSRIILFIFLFYNFFVFIDLKVRKSSALLTKYNFQEKENILLKGKEEPLILKVINVNNIAIKGLDLKIYKKSINYNEPLIVDIIDNNSRRIDKIFFSLFNINNLNDEFTYINFNRAITHSQFTIKIYNKNPRNEILIPKSKIVSIGDKNNYYAGYDTFYSEENVKIIFPNFVFYVNLRGDYPYFQMFNYFKKNILQKPKFFLAYSSIILFLFVLVIFLIPKLLLFRYQKAS